MPFISPPAVLAEGYRQMGIYVGKILNGTRLADLPVQRRPNSSWSSISNLQDPRAGIPRLVKIFVGAKFPARDRGLCSGCRRAQPAAARQVLRADPELF